MIRAFAAFLRWLRYLEHRGRILRHAEALVRRPGLATIYAPWGSSADYSDVEAAVERLQQKVTGRRSSYPAYPPELVSRKPMPHGPEWRDD